MKVRGWLMIGPQSAVHTGMLGPVGPLGHVFGPVPNAADQIPGTVIWWTPAGSPDALTLVCVELPVE